MKDQLVIDAGNTRIKVGVFRNHALHSVHFTDSSGIQRFDIHAIVSGSFDMIYSPVRGSSTPLPKWALKGGGTCIRMDENPPLPISIDYLTPETLGFDRIANAVGAHARHGGSVLIVDCGSCITLTTIMDGVLTGGSISPGLSMRFRALAEFTAGLPLVAVPDARPEFPGRSTADSIAEGVLSGVVDEIQEKITRWRASHPESQCVLTGGDSGMLAELLKTPIFADPELTLYGLHEILNYHID